MLKTTEVNLAIGLVGSELAWNSSVVQYDRITQGGGASSAVLDTSETSKALSLQSGLITLVVKGDPLVFASPMTSTYSLQIDSLVSLHFLSKAKFDTVKAMIDAGEV
jgi:hypothetical protein